MVMSGRVKHLLLYTVLHFLVDFSCIFFLVFTASVSTGSHEQWIAIIMCYNFVAFALPMFIGVVADVIERDERVASLGCALVFIAYLVKMMAVSFGLWNHMFLWGTVSLLGLGNGMFHIGGGRQVLQENRGIYGPCGFFISVGAMGVYLGRFFGAMHLNLEKEFMTALVIGAIFAYGAGSGKSVCAMSVIGECDSQFDTDYLERNNFNNRKNLFLAIIPLFLVVILRSYYGFLTSYTWNTGFAMTITFSVCIMFGKCLGGFAADRFGIWKISIASLGFAGVLAVFSFNLPICGLISILCFNMTMPLTLSLMYRLFDKWPGFAFGLLMAALFIGTVPNLVLGINFGQSPFGLFAWCMISLGLLLFALFFMKGRMQEVSADACGKV